MRVHAVFERALEVYPAFMARQCLAVCASGRIEPLIRQRLVNLIHRHGEATVRGWMDGLGTREAKVLDALTGSDREPAPVETWPEVLRAPPWRRKAHKPAEDIVLVLSPLPTPFGYEMGKPDPESGWTERTPPREAQFTPLAEHIRSTETYISSSQDNIPSPAEPIPGDETPYDQLVSWIYRRLTGLGKEGGDYLYWKYYGRWFIFLGYNQPEPLALMLWSLTDCLLKKQVYLQRAVQVMMSRFGERALPGFLRLIETGPAALLDLALPVDAADLAPVMAEILSRRRPGRATVISWLRRHCRTAVMRLIPAAVGTPGPARNAAEYTLRWLVGDQADAAAIIAAAVEEYAGGEPRVREAMAQVLGRDPLAQYPLKITAAPAWLVPATLTRPLLRAGGALPDEAVLALCEMLSFSTPDAVYAGVTVVCDACTKDSLAAFAWDLFSAWLVEGAPPKDAWTMRALGWLGDDACARKLAHLIRRWPGEAAHARAVSGLDVLAILGSDVALMNLNSIAEKVKFKGLQERAREKIAQLAAARDLTPVELADRLAPDLDLDERGGMELDFGPRRFRVGFDELLKPWVKDDANTRLKDLPKPNKSDDEEKSAAAVARWATLKKDARAAASLQLMRLEAMLVTARRLRPEVFQVFFATHPLVRHLVQRLVWGVYDDTAPMATPRLAFRVGEDLSFTNAADAPVALDVSAAASGAIGLVHPLQMRPGEAQAWGTLFGDYEIAQPFPQLSRETYALTEAEKASRVLDRFQGVKVETVRLRGMGAHGWTLGEPGDGGWIAWIEREVALISGDTATVTFRFAEGLWVGSTADEEKMLELRELRFGRDWYPSATDETGPRFGDLDALTASEMLRGLVHLANTGTR